MKIEPMNFHRPYIWILIALIFLAWAVRGQPIPPTPKAVAVPIVSAPAVTNVVLSWDGYTNAWFEVMACTNLAEGHWYHVTNVPITSLSMVLANTRRQEFFQVKTRYAGNILTN